MISYLWSYFVKMSPHVLLALQIALCIIAVCAALFFIIRRKHPQFGAKLPRSFLFAFPLACFFLCVIATTTLANRTPQEREVYLVPFHYIVRAFQKKRYFEWGQILMNIAIFIPAGILPPLLHRSFESWRRILLPGAILSVVIELTQFFTQLGFADVDDVLLNVLGTLIGALLYKGVIAVMRKRKSGKSKKNV